MNPPRYWIPRPQAGDFSLIVVGECYAFIKTENELGGKQQEIRIDKHSEEIAASICNDFKTAQFGYEAGKAEPCLFWIRGEHSKDEVEIEFQDIFAIEKEKNLTWMRNLIMYADDAWNKYRNHKLITEMMRKSAIALNHQAEWVRAAITDQVKQIKCPACQQLIPTTAIVCFHCKYIVDKKLYKAEAFAT